MAAEARRQALQRGVRLVEADPVGGWANFLWHAQTFRHRAHDAQYGEP